MTSRESVLVKSPSENEPDLDFVVAMTDERVIGRGNTLPWYLPQDLKRFKQITTGHSVLMGRKTYESIGKPLPGRKNIVLTRDKDYRRAGIHVVHDLDSGIRIKEGDLFVIGGAEIFAQTLPRLRKLYLTLVHESIPGDAYFPDIDLEREFDVVDKSETFEEPLRHTFLILERRRSR